MSGQATTILLTGAGIDGGPDIIRALRADEVLAARVVGVDSNPQQPVRHLCDSFHQVAPRDDPGYVEQVAGIAEAERAAVIYPLPSFDQAIFADARPGLEERGLRVPVSPPESIRVCNDKWLLYESVGRVLPQIVPETRPVGSAEELAEVARSFGYPERPVCVRRRVSRGAIGFRVLDTGPARLAALIERNPGSSGSLVTSLDEVVDCLRQANPFPDYMVQEYIPGDEWDVDVLCRDGESISIATRHNVGMTVSAATHAVLKHSEPISTLTRQVVEELGLNAVVSLSFRHDADGNPKLIEINARIPFSILAAMAGGVNLVALAVRQALGERIEPLEPRWGGQFLLHFQSLITDPAGERIELPPAGPSARG